MKATKATCNGRRLLVASLFVLLAALPAWAQRALTLDDIYDPDRRINFGGSPPTSQTWMDADRYLEPRDAGGGGVVWTIVHAAEGRTQPLFDAARMRDAVARLDGLSDADAQRLSRSRTLSFDAAFTRALFTAQSDLFVYHLQENRAVRLTRTPAEELVPAFSPDGTRVAFVRDHDLYVTDTATGTERRLTSDGAAKILNGLLDWVYEEEIYGRGRRRAYWWSPDSTRLAFLRTDDTPVPPYVVVDDIPYDQTVERWDYPKPGDPNPIVTLGVAAMTGDPVRWADLSAWPDADRLLTGVTWTPEGTGVMYQVQNRIQNWLEVRVFDVGTHRDRRLLRETSDAWVTTPDLGSVRWLRDGSFLWLSERTGWQHVYHYRADGSLIRAITRGDWDIRTLHGVDDAGEWIYFSGTERSYIGLDVYRIRLDGIGMERLSSAPGTHNARFSTGFRQYLDAWSDVTTPPEVRLHRHDGRQLRVIAENQVAALAEFDLSTPEFLQVAARDGFELDAMIIRPPDFDPARRYPVYQFTYAGPQAPSVRNAWGGTQYMYHQLLAQKGIIVWVCDNRTASAKGIQSAWPVYRSFGELELRDIEDCLSWLTSQPYVDDDRIGIHGWSFGGYMTSYALTHSRRFVMGIAGGTVSDWRAYDSVYTERYMGLPSDNEEGYRRSAPRWAASDLHGALMLIHGAMDDNVHPANTLQFAYELQKAQKPFELMLYPKSRHGITDPQLVKHLRATMLSFTERHLLGPLQAVGTTRTGSLQRRGDP